MTDFSYRLTNGDDTDGWQGQMNYYAEFVFNSLFIIEFMVKATAMGFCFEKRTYLRDGWNIIDFLVICAGFLQKKI